MGDSNGRCNMNASILSESFLGFNVKADLEADESSARVRPFGTCHSEVVIVAGAKYDTEVETLE